MGSTIFSRKDKSERSPKSDSRKLGVAIGAALLVGVGAGGFWLGNENGHSDGVEDCNQAFGPDKMLSVGQKHPLSTAQVAAMILLAKSDTKPVSFHTSEADLESAGLEPILDDLSRGQIISVSIPEEVMLSGDSEAATKNALTVGNILKSWADDSDSMVKLTPEGTQQEVDTGTEVLVEIQAFRC